MEKFRFLEIKCIDDETGRIVHIEDTTKTNPHMVFYRADDVDAAFQTVARLVEAAKLCLILHHDFCGGWYKRKCGSRYMVEQDCDCRTSGLKQAIAEVERVIAGHK